MNPYCSLFRFATCLSLLLSCFSDIKAESVVQGQLENGIDASFLSSFNTQKTRWVIMGVSVPHDEECQAVAQLTQHALLYGTKTKTREEIATFLNDYRIDLDAKNFIECSEQGCCFQMGFTPEQAEKFSEVLAFMNDLLFSAILDDQGIELARRQLLSEKESLALQCVTAQEVRDFYAMWYKPDNAFLIVAGVEESVAVKSAEQNFGAFTPSEEPTQVENLSDIQGDTLVDGKIWMREPNWINKSTNGKALGGVLALIGLAGLIAAIPLAAPIAFVLGSLSLISGTFFLTSDYFKDPQYVAMVRQEDLKKGCVHAYTHKRAGITLTPFERRALFLKEMVEQPHLLPSLPIVTLTDVYKLDDPIIAELFTGQEFAILNSIKAEFIQQRNQFKALKELLEKELAVLTAPYAELRDMALKDAKASFNANPYIVRLKELKEEYDAASRDIKKACEEGTITFEESQNLIKDLDDRFQAIVNEAEFQAGLSAARYNLESLEKTILENYALQLEVCKRNMRYEERIAAYNNGQNAVTELYNQLLRDQLASFPVYLDSLSDILDLRSI